MTERLPPDPATVRRFVLHGVWAGALLGVALSLLLRNIFGPPQHYLAKTLGILVIVAAFGGFVGALAEAFARSRRP